MTQPIVRKFNQLAQVMIQKYERYLPNAFDESLTLLEKVNKIIEYLNQTGQIVNSVVEQWNEVVEWVINEGLIDTMNKALDEMYADGRLAQLINVQMIGNLSDLDTDFKENLVGAINEVYNSIVDFDFEDISDDFNEKLAYYGVNILNYGGVGDGVTDDSQAFIDAHTKAISKNTEVYFPSGSYILENVDQTLITNMRGNDAEIHIKGNVSLNYNSNLRIDGVNIVSDYAVDSSVPLGTLIIALNETDNVTLKNVEYTVETNILSGTTRGKSLTKTKAQNVNIVNFKAKNSRMPIVIESSTTNPVKSVTIKNYFTENVQTGLYLAGQINARVQNVSIDNIRLINTSQQKSNYSRLNGADLIMAENTKNVNIRNVYSENPCERAIYMNVVDNIKVDNVILNDSDGVKVVGFVDKANARYEYSNNISVTNVLQTNGFEGRTLTFYEVKKVNIDNISSFNDINKAVDTVVLFERSVEDVRLNNVNGRNSRRSVIRFDAVSDSSFDTYFKDIFIDGIKFINPTTRTNLYAGLDFRVGGTPTSYLFQNINIDNVYLENQVADNVERGKLFYYRADGNLKGLIEIDRVDGLRISNSFATGIRDLNGGLFVGTNSRQVAIETEIVALSSDFAPTGLYASPTSKIKCVRYDSGKSSNIENTITPIGVDFYDVVNVKNSHKGELEGSLSLYSNGASLELPYTNGIVVVTSDNGEYITAHISSTTVTKINGSTNSVTTNTAGNLCVYIEGGQLHVRNRMATTLKVNVSYKYINN